MPDGAPLAYLTLIRHAESRANVERVLQGVTDAPLSLRGNEQLEALEAAWRAQENAPNAFGLPSPHLVVASPIGRAHKTGQAVARGCGLHDTQLGDITFRSPPAEPPAAQRHPALLIDSGLSERNFGSAECTRKGQLVSGYTKPPAKEIGRADTHTSFHKKVTRAGDKWLQWLVAVAEQAMHLEKNAHSQHDPTAEVGFGASREATPQEEAVASREATPDADDHAASDTKPSEDSGTQKSVMKPAEACRPNSTARASPVVLDPPHLVLVSHGQWIHTFLQAAIPELRDTFYIRSSNTGVFTLALHKQPQGRPRLRVVHHDDTRHLGVEARPTKKRAVQRTTLTGLWHASGNNSSTGK